MLGKSLKYEIKSTGRLFIPMYGALLVFAIMNRFFILISESANFSYDMLPILEIPQNVVSFAYGIMLIATLVFTFVIMIQRFYKNLLSDEGYLMFTLPVKTSNLISSKLIVSIIWSFATSLVTIISILILVVDKHFFAEAPQAIKMFFLQVKNAGVSGHFTAYIFELLVLMVVMTALGILMVYASISIGHLFNRRRTIGAIGAFLALGMLIQFVLLSFSITLSRQNSFTQWVLGLKETTAVHFIFLAIIFVIVILSAIFYFITDRILTKKLNLD